uniref:Uncharacterized protein n=1 Tax=Rhizophora mucronata TaxID=61149 RepID=A0A2P2NX66_RHIMU
MFLFINFNLKNSPKSLLIINIGLNQTLQEVKTK